jgi:hypothetical protein
MAILNDLRLNLRKKISVPNRKIEKMAPEKIPIRLFVKVEPSGCAKL